MGFPFCLLPPAFCLLNLFVLSPIQVLAGSGARIVYQREAQGINSAGIELKVWRGYGLTINFIPTGETIKQVWIGDPTRISFTSNGSLCQKTDNSSSNDSTSNCGQANATVIFLRQIKPISFPNITNSIDGSTQITVITSGSDGQKQYQFKLIPVTGQPSYTSLVIKPDVLRPLPVIRTKPQIVPTVRENKMPVTTTAPPQERVAAVTPVKTTNSIISPGIPQARNDANALVYGLANAGRNGQIKPGSATWNKVQDAIKLLRLGKSREIAISHSGISEEIFNQLIEWGQR
ncbi:hypothetical protein [Nostoc sp. FACHB-133]|uniref:hypothetical protein n=1 Tax=Nostoc sp. FACHB-133 TaxID=2692835 RepID=UPI0016827127|nr:hypothetical protein [Nostoc sp. FACHB-133]MBD2527322.1 hypothetical protein [Nostoc sp. FACHB-133]